jgi:hypothetical protein
MPIMVSDNGAIGIPSPGNVPPVTTIPISARAAPNATSATDKARDYAANKAIVGAA